MYRWFLGLSVAFSIQGLAQTRVLYTAAVIDSFYDSRKEEYLRSIESLQKMGYVPYVVEACKDASFFDLLGVPVFYSQVNDSSLRNKGVNEARSMKKALEHYAFDENDMIIKLTGRYCLIDNYFLSEVEHSQADALAKKTLLHPYPLSEIDYFTGCFAMRCKYLTLFLDELDLQKMEEEQICIEWELGRFLQKHPEISVQQMKSLHVKAHIFGKGSTGKGSLQ